MRYANAMAIALIAAAADAATVWIDAAHAIIQRPQSIGATANPTDAALASFGIVPATGPDGVDPRFWVWAETNFVSAPQSQIDSALAEEAAAQAAAEEQASLPQVFPTGVAVLDADGHHVELVPVADGEPVIAVRVSQSPLSPGKRDELKAAAIAARAAKMESASTAKKNGNLQKRIEALENLEGVE